MSQLKATKGFDSCLFLGLYIDSTLQKELDLLSSELKSLFIQSQEAYLTLYQSKDGRFLGKFLGKSTNLADMELSVSNIYSLLKKIIPNYSYDKSELWLIPVSHEE